MRYANKNITSPHRGGVARAVHGIVRPRPGAAAWRATCLLLASFPGPAQLFVACSTETVLIATESWAGPGNEAIRYHEQLVETVSVISHIESWLKDQVYEFLEICVPCRYCICEVCDT